MFDIQLTGDKQLIKNLEKLKKSTQKKFVRQAVNKSLTPMLKQAKKNTPKRYGILKKSLGRITKTYKDAIWGRIGVRSGFKTQKDGKNIDPSNYAHLIELGTHNKPGSHFLGRAFEQHKRGALKIFEKELINKIEAEAKRLGAKSK